LIINNLQQTPLFLPLFSFCDEINEVIHPWGSEIFTATFHGVKVKGGGPSCDSWRPTAARVMCCKEILDRTLGKPAALITPVEEVKSDNPIAEVERLELEIKQLSKGSSDGK
jgi:hypothetical protein